jgi:hypothetical protein
MVNLDTLAFGYLGIDLDIDVGMDLDTEDTRRCSRAFARAVPAEREKIARSSMDSCNAAGPSGPGTSCSLFTIWSQYALSSASSTTVPNFAMNSALERALQTAR